METPHSTIKGLTPKKENPTGSNHNNSTKFKIGQTVIVKNHAWHTFKPKYVFDYKVLKYLMTTHFCS